METYSPKPMDLSKIEIPEDLIPLIEKLAENVHDEWAQERIRCGWTYGPERNDPEKKHPCLVPYDQLTEDEKSYDRITAESTIKAIIGAGFKIQK